MRGRAGARDDGGMRIAIPLYDKFTALDAVGPYVASTGDRDAQQLLDIERAADLQPL